LIEILHTHTQICQEKTDIHESEEKIRAHRASSKATNYFLPSNESNINHIRYKQAQTSSIEVGAGSLKAQFAKRGTE